MLIYLKKFSKNLGFVGFLGAFAAAVAVAVTAFILVNAAVPPLESESVSDSVQQVVEPIVREPIEQEVGKIGEERFIYLFRKAGHVVEYAVLSAAVITVVLATKRKIGRTFAGFGAFYCLLVANLDEYIQGFVGRSSLVKDIFIDISGIVVGAVLTLLLWLAVDAVSKKVIKNRKDSVPPNSAN